MKTKIKLTEMQRRIIGYIDEKNKEGKNPSTTNVAMATYSGFVITKHRLDKLMTKGLIINKQNEHGFIHWELKK